MVPDDDERLAKQRRRRSLSELIAHPLITKVLLPDQRAVQVVGIQAKRLEVGIDAFPIRQRRARGPGTVGLMSCLVGFLFVRHAFPERSAGVPVNRHHAKLMHAARCLASARLMLRLTRGPHRDRRRHEDPIIPDDR